MEGIKAKLKAIFGAANVSDDPKVLAGYASDKSFAKAIAPAYVVKASNADQVEALVKFANEAKLPLIPVSSGAPHYRGDTVPSVAGAVIVDLSGMKKIISINSLHRMAVIEPGVTYGEFQKALAKEGMHLAYTLAPRAGKSVLADVMDVEPRLNAMHGWSYTEPFRCVEVTWGDGRRMYTGDAANGGPVGSLEKQFTEEKWQVSPLGPMMLDFYRLLTQSQGTMGIVTWASIRCELAHQAHDCFFLAANEEKDLLNFVWDVNHVRFSEEMFIMNKAEVANLMGKDAAEIAALKTALPAWIVFVGVGGRELLPKERCEQQAADIGEIAQKNGLTLLRSVGGVSATSFYKKAISVCPEGKYWKETQKGAFQDIFFLSKIDDTAMFIDKMNSLAAAAGYPVSDIGVYVQPIHMGTAYHVAFTLPYDPENKKETALVKDLFIKASEALAAAGAYYARPHGPWARIQLNKDAMNTKSLMKLKGIFDPNGIMNPGKISI
ncbi:MAG: FAD-binding oxidoreductase [Oscillospiraceae bacterium]|nr:FAD-binding oxidoreductase [Oscillospiraceae bacterium]